MDSGTDTLDKEEVVQPVEVVETEAEITKANPQAEATEQEELYIDEDEGDQEKPTTGMTQAQAYAAFQKEKRKRKDKQEQIDKDTVEKDSLRKELAELKAQVGDITRGEMPDPYDFDNKEDHYKALKEWEGTAAPKAVETKQVEQQDNASDEAEFYLYQKEQDLTKLLPDYQKSKDALIKVFADDGMTNPKGAMLFLANIAQQKGIDIAKAVMTMERIPSLVEDIKRAGNNQFMIGDILEKAANKVKTRTKKPITTQPEPEINNTGQVNVLIAEIKKAKEKYAETGSHADYAALQKARNKKVNE